ncbi:hypothetical protein CVT24_007167 [Panaeolus cyanescens]|uniref:F-box domain-containing protein n=1 Tax=Panaeolus cyanescens TaxID=181874 RepID=A0A409YPJ1_9AGAR|nr:hypothetical protein CVT24_007167 [Panaeolus cyanescens]
MGLLTLPPELILQILRCRPTVSKEEQRFLGACRMTCKVMSTITVPIMFHEISLGSASDWQDQIGPQERVQAFRSLLEVDPHLATHIKSFTIFTNDWQPFLASSDLEVVIRKLQRVTHFTLSVFTIKPKLRWSQLTESLVGALEVMCNLPSIVYLQFQGIVDLPLFRLIQSRSNLEELNLYHITLDLQGHGIPTTRLKSLRLLNVCPSSSQNIEPLFNAPLLRNLEQFHAYFSSPDKIEQVQMIMEHAQETLKRLTLQMWYTMDEEWMSNNISRFFKHSLPALESVSIDGYSHRIFSSDISTENVPHLLNQVAQSSFTIKHVSVFGTPPYKTIRQENAIWLEIDRVLCQKYLRLEELIVQCNDDMFQRDSPEQVHNAIKAVRSVLGGVLGALKASIRLRILTRGEESEKGDILIVD